MSDEQKKIWDCGIEYQRPDLREQLKKTSHAAVVKFRGQAPIRYRVARPAPYWEKMEKVWSNAEEVVFYYNDRVYPIIKDSVKDEETTLRMKVETTDFMPKKILYSAELQKFQKLKKFKM